MDIMDYHIHTNNSFDSRSRMEDVCKESIRKGITEICLTEHFSLNPLAPTYGHMDFNRFFREITYCREKYQNQLMIKAGIEICEPHQLKEEYTETIKQYDLDFVLGSVHNIDNKKLRKFLENKTNTYAYDKYFAEVYNMACSADIDVIAHLDLLKRYAISTICFFDFNEFKDQIGAILEKSIERDIGIEINTSGLRGKLNTTLPSINILKLYKDLGGEILTIGSDSHTPKSLGGNFFEALDMANECGFRYIFKFERRNPIAVNIKM